MAVPSDGVITIHDINSGKELVNLGRSSGDVKEFVVNHATRRIIATGYKLESIRIWNYETGELEAELVHDFAASIPQAYENRLPLPIIASEDGSLIITSIGDTTIVWDTNTRYDILLSPPPPAPRTRLTLNSEIMAQLVHQIDDKDREGGPDTIQPPKFAHITADNHLVTMTSDNAVHIWSLSTFVLVRRVKLPGYNRGFHILEDRLAFAASVLGNSKETLQVELTLYEFPSMEFKSVGPPKELRDRWYYPNKSHFDKRGVVLAVWDKGLQRYTISVCFSSLILLIDHELY